MKSTRRKLSSIVGMRNTKRIGDSTTFLLLVLISVIMLFPVWIMLITAIKTPAEVFQFPPSLIPRSFMFDNFPNAIENMRLARAFRNSIFVSSMVSIGTVMSSSLVAFGFYRYRAPGKNILFMFVLSTLMIPYAAYMIPQFILFHHLGWVNTFLPIIVPPFFGSAFSIFLFRQFFSTLPHDLFDAARIDGASEFTCYWKIAMPLCGAAIAAVIIFSFIWSWDDLLAPLLYLHDSDLHTLPYAMALFRTRFRVLQWNEIMAAALMASLPCFILFVTCQKYFVEGIVTSGIKG